MTQLAITNDWLPVDQWIAEALGKSADVSQIESDFVDCLLFWGGKYSIKGTSSRDSLEKSLEAVRILVSLGIEYHFTDARGDSSISPRVRDFFKAPFARLKTLESIEKIDTILGLEVSSNNPKDLTAYWTAETNQRIDSRLYAIIRKQYENCIQESILRKEILSILNRLIKITGIQCQSFRLDSFNYEMSAEMMIRTVMAIKLNRIKRPKNLREISLNSEYSTQENLALTNLELIKIRDNASLIGNRKKEIDTCFYELVNQLDISNDAMQKIFENHNGLWTDYILKLWEMAILSAKKQQGKKEKDEIPSDPLWHFGSHFIVIDDDYKHKIAKLDIDDDMFNVLNSIFSGFDIKYSSKDLHSARGDMPKKELDAILRKAEKKGYILSTNESGRKFYILRQHQDHV